MLLIILDILFIVLCFVSFYMALDSWDNEDLWFGIALASLIIVVGINVFGFFNGFINYPTTEGIHQGTITAVDLEGIFYRKYKVYLKSGGYANQDNGSVSDETEYLIYDYETELAEQLKNAIGKTVKLKYGHDGGYKPWYSCGTYHIKSVEIIEE